MSFKHHINKMQREYIKNNKKEILQKAFPKARQFEEKLRDWSIENMNNKLTAEQLKELLGTGAKIQFISDEETVDMPDKYWNIDEFFSDEKITIEEHIAIGDFYLVEEGE